MIRALSIKWIAQITLFAFLVTLSGEYNTSPVFATGHDLVLSKEPVVATTTKEITPGAGGVATTTTGETIAIPPRVRPPPISATGTPQDPLSASDTSNQNNNNDGGGGKDNLVIVIGVIVVAVVTWLLVKWFRSPKTTTDPKEIKETTKPEEPHQEKGVMANSILVMIPIGSEATMLAIGEGLALRHQMQLVEVHPLASIQRGLLVFGLLEQMGGDSKIAALALDPTIIFAQPNFSYETAADVSSEVSPLSYGSRLIRADWVQAVSSGEGVTIALIDTGVDQNHVALKGSIIETIDFTGEGFSPDLHGTLLAGIIVAKPAKGVEVLGIAPNAKLIAIKSCKPKKPDRIEAICSSVNIARGLDAALLKGARVINLSVGGPKDRLVSTLIDEAEKQNKIVIAAAGNGGPTGITPYPAGLENLIAVTAVDAEAQIYPNATRGEFIDIAAPGVEILSTAPHDQVRFASGTSFAAAYLSSSVALLLQQRETLSFLEVKSILEGTAKDLGAPGKDAVYGSGLLDVCRSMAMLTVIAGC